MKRGQLGIGNLQVVAITIVVVVLVMGFGAMFLVQMKNASNQSAVNGPQIAIFDYGLSGLNTLGSYLGMIVLAIVAVIIIFLLVRTLGGLSGGKQG